jgi:hypothetical protein
MNGLAAGPIKKHGVGHGGVVGLGIIIRVFMSDYIDARVGGAFVVAGEHREFPEFVAILIGNPYLAGLVDKDDLAYSLKRSQGLAAGALRSRSQAASSTKLNFFMRDLDMAANQEIFWSTVASS